MELGGADDGSEGGIGLGAPLGAEPVRHLAEDYARAQRPDGAYDGEPTYQAVSAKQPHPPPNVVIPPRVTAIPSKADTARDRHIAAIAERGRMAWQTATGYGRRNLVETAIGRYKVLIGPRLRSRNWRAQRSETVIGVEALNRMIRIAKPVSARVV